MTRHEVLAFVPPCPGAAVDGLAFVHSPEGSAVLVAAAAPVLRLPDSRRTRLLRAAKRQRRLEALMPFGSVLPVAPGIEMSKVEAERFLRANAPMLRARAAALGGLVQFQVTVRWDAAQVLRAFRDAPEISALFEGPQPSAEALIRGIAALSDRLVAEMDRLLDPVLRDIAALPREDGMLFNAAVLIDAKTEPDLDATVEAIDAIWPEGFHIQQIGPAPASSFATVVPRLVGLAEQAAAYEALALVPGTPEARRTDVFKAALRAAVGPEVATLRDAHSVVEAAERLGGRAPFHLCDLWQEGKATFTPSREVA